MKCAYMNTFNVILQYEFAFKGFGAYVTGINFVFMINFNMIFQFLFGFEIFCTSIT